MIAISAGSIIFSKDITNDLDSIQALANNLGDTIENKLNEKREETLRKLDSELFKAHENYLDIIPQINEKHLLTTVALVNMSMSCYLHFESDLSAAYKQAGVDASACLIAFNKETNNITVSAFDDAVMRLYPVELPSFVLKETEDKNMLTEPDITLIALEEQKHRIEEEWETEFDQLELNVAEELVQLSALNNAFNKCLGSTHNNFKARADEIISISQTIC